MRFSFSYFEKNLKRETLNQSRVFNECKINDQESDDDVASINSKDDGNAIAANQPTFELCVQPDLADMLVVVVVVVVGLQVLTITVTGVVT